MDFNDPKEFDNPKGISTKSMNLDNPKVDDDTSIFDGRVSYLEPAASVISTTIPSSALSQWWLQRRRDHVQVTFPGLGQRRKTETETVTDTKTIKYAR